MAYIAPKIQARINMLPQDLKTEILTRDVELKSLNDLISVLESIASEEEA